MYLHLYINRIKCLFKDKSLFFWSLCYPMILGTLFYAGFGNSMDLQENFNTIPVAFVTDGTENDEFYQILTSVSNGDNQKLFEVVSATKEEADHLLEEKEVDGIIVSADDLSLIVKTSDMNQSILKSFLDQYQQTTAILSDISTTNPDKLTNALTVINDNTQTIKDVSLRGGSTSAFIQLYYALIAMTCLLGSYYGLKNTTDTQANLSPTGARRSVTPTHKLSLILTDTCAAITLHFTQIVLVFLYLRFVLRIPIGDQPVLFLICCFIGCLIGVFLGQFLGTIIKCRNELKSMVLTATTLILSFLGGLMIPEMKDWIEKSFPLINRINPITLLTDAFYCLTVFDDYNRFTENLISLSAMAIFFCIVSFIITRRERYASL